MATLQTYEIASRRHKSVVAIPWAEPAPVVAVPYPSFLEPKLLKRKALKRNLLEVELDQFTFIDPFAASGFYPGSSIARAFKSSYTTKLQLVTGLDEYPAAAVPEQPFTAYLEQPYFVRQEKRHALSLPELDFYPAVVLTPATLPAFFSIDILFRRDIKRELLDLLPVAGLTDEPALAQGPGFGVASTMNNDGVGVEGLISSSGIGKEGLIVDGFGVASVISDTGIGREGLINNDGIGREGEI